jgi:small-conductance mechanosensitive channel
MTLYSLVVTGHVFLVVVAFGAHGAAALTMFEVKRESDRARLAAVLDLSIRSFSVAIWALLGAVLLGVAATIMGNHGGRLWVWVSVAVLVTMVVLMTPLAGGPMNRVRRALGLRSERNGPGMDPAREPLSDDELTAARAALRPGRVALVGLAGTLALVWLMEAKPF